jgi:hypothetical protein
MQALEDSTWFDKEGFIWARRSLPEGILGSKTFSGLAKEYGLKTTYIINPKSTRSGNTC